MLLGFYTIILDTGNRIALPKELAEDFDDGLFVTQGFDRNIIVLTLDAFEEVYERAASVNIADPLARLLLRMILGQAHKAEVGTDGTIQIPEKLMEFAQLEHEVVLVGQGDFMEIWSSEVWKRQKEQMQEFEVDPARFSSLLITTR